MKLMKGPPFDAWRIPIDRFVANMPPEQRARWEAINPDVADDEYNGHFYVPCNGALLMVIASNGGGWDHVSVSRPARIPSWTEMEFVKRTFFKDDEVAMQLHVTPADHINLNPNVLHIWRPHEDTIPLPPDYYV